jgi:hypothetical protein
MERVVSFGLYLISLCNEQLVVLINFVMESEFDSLIDELLLVDCLSTDIDQSGCFPEESEMIKGLEYGIRTEICDDLDNTEEPGNGTTNSD